MSKPLAVVDCEVYRNYFLCKLRRVDNGAVIAFQMWSDGPWLDRAHMDYALRQVTLVSFNGINYDMVVIAAALAGFSCDQIKRVSDFIIQGNMRPWDCERQFNFRIPAYDHIDLIEVVPTTVSLKVMMGRLHCRKMQDLPIEHDQMITPEQRGLIYTYNDNDLDGTEALLRKFWDQIKLRYEMSTEYGIDLRSKSDAQIAEAVIKRKLTDLGVNVRKAAIEPRAFKYQFPAFLHNAGPIVQEVMRQVRESDFLVEPSGYVKMPEQLAKAKIQIGQSVYRMGIGGLHSSEQSVEHYADDQWLLLDRDVASYYPAIIITTALYPRHLGPEFLDVYRRMRDERIAAKNRAATIKKRIKEIERLLNE